MFMFVVGKHQVMLFIEKTGLKKWGEESWKVIKRKVMNEQKKVKEANEKAEKKRVSRMEKLLY
jgi:hypothetical protein